MRAEWYVYVVECDDETLYTGITTDVERRVSEHNGSSSGARYTRSRRPVELVAAWPCEDRSEAASLEARFKALTRGEKLERVEVGARPGRLDAVAEAYAEALAIADVDRASFRPVAPVESGEFAVAHAMQRGVREARERFDEDFSEVQQPPTDPHFFVGPGRFDGHALEVAGEPVVFFDIRVVGDHFEEEDFDPDVHAVHEWTHALHYSNRPAFYPGRDKSPAEEVWHRLVAEGLAAIASEELTGCDAAESTWFGLLESERIEAWRERAEARRDAIGESIFGLEETVRFDGELWNELFRSVGESSESRLGYWYGRELVRDALEEASLGALLTAGVEAWEPRIARYFGG